MKFYFDQDIDLFKDYCTLPGIARKLLFKSTNVNFALMDENNADLYHTFKKILLEVLQLYLQGIMKRM